MSGGLQLSNAQINSGGGALKSDDPFAGHVVAGMTPAGTTVNLFDYWTQDGGEESGRTKSDKVDPGINNEWGSITEQQRAFIDSAGINQYSALKFRKDALHVSGGDHGEVNCWTGNGDKSKASSPQFNLVQNVLGEDGYPVLTRDDQRATDGRSLAYLFNETDYKSGTKGKQVFANADGLFQQDANGYYYYNSSASTSNPAGANFAWFDEEAGKFVLYDSPGVVATGGATQDLEGQFFPFNDAKTVFNTPSSSEGTLSPKSNLKANNEKMNHYFGLTMSTQFVQNPGGLREDGSPITYEFSGDDDVWIYVDDVLVGDLGGLHDASSIKIDFSSGKIIIYGDIDNSGDYNENADKVWKDTTLRACFEAAEKDNGSMFDGDTFRDGSVHTLKFFYLERGNTDSNLRLKFNFPTLPESQIKKVDQEGNPIAGVAFGLYDADDNYNLTGNTAIATGTTAVDGTVELKYVAGENAGKTLSLKDLYNQYGNGSEPHFVLREDNNSPGYRKSEDMHLRIQRVAGIYVMMCDNQWQTGAYAQASGLLTAPNEAHQYGSDKVYSTEDLTKGTLFAVVLKRMDNNGTMPTQATKFYPLAGDSTNGWKIFNPDKEGTAYEGNIMAAVVAAAKDPGSQFVFGVGSTGGLQTTISEMPGDITKYWGTLTGDDRKQTEYAIGYYFCPGATSIDDVDPAKTVRLDDGHTLGGNAEFTVEAAVNLYVPNIENRIYVQKVDEKGNPVDGVTFNVYTEAQVEKDGAGNAVRVKPEEVDSPFDVSEPTRHLDPSQGDYVNLQGATKLPSAQGAKPEQGTMYYVQEKDVPRGYTLNDTLIPVYVSYDGAQSGVFIDAGTKDDGVSVQRGVGRLVPTMHRFASDGDIDTTLTNIQAQLMKGTLKEVDGKRVWQDIDSYGDVDALNHKNDLHLRYGAPGTIVEYGPETDGIQGELDQSAVSLRADEGWTRLKIAQCMEHTSSGAGKKEDLSKLGINEITPLFSRSAVAIVQDDYETTTAHIDVSKNMSGRNFKPGETFTFSLTADDTPGNENAPMPEGTEEGKSATLEVTASTEEGADLSQAITGSFADMTFSAEDLFENGSIPDGKTKDYTYTVAEVPNENATNAAVNEGKTAYKDASSQDQAQSGWTYQGITYDSDPVKVTITLSYEGEGADAQLTTSINYAKRGATSESQMVDNTDQLANDQGDNDADLSDGDEPGDEPTPIVAQSPSAQFKNVYKTTSTSISLSGNKILSREDDTGEFTFANGQFSFLVAAAPSSGQTAEGYPMPQGGTNAENVSGSSTPTIKITNGDPGEKLVEGEGSKQHAPINFGTITFTQAGVYVYNISEDATTLPAGISSDGVRYVVTVTVVDNGDGTLSATSKVDKILIGGGKAPSVGIDQIDFTNTFKTASVEGSQSFVKRLDGRQWLDDDTFRFRVSMTAMELNDVADASKGTKPWAMDNTDLPSVIATWDEDGNPIGEGQEAAPYDFAYKTNGDKGFDYSIVISPDPEIAANPQQWQFDSGFLTYTKPGVYTFEVREDTSSVSHVDSSEVTFTIKVTITQHNDENGSLILEHKASISSSTEDGTVTGAMTFTNTYKPDSTSATLDVAKALIGREWHAASGDDAGDAFAFELTRDAVNPTAPMPADAQGDKATTTVTKGESADPYRASFGEITFTKEDMKDATGAYVMQKDFVYHIKETSESGWGITADDRDVTATVTVTDNGTGTLASKVSYSGGASIEVNGAPITDAAAFANSYSATGKAVLEVQKSLANRDWQEGDSFRFTLAAGESKAEDGTVIDTPMPTTGLTATIDNTTENHRSQFGEIVFNQAGTYSYAITETGYKNRDVPADGTDGLTFDKHSATATVVMKDKGDGTLECESITYANSNAPGKGDVENATIAAFTNSYAPQASVPLNLVARKTLIGTTGNQSFSFMLKAADDDTLNAIEGETASIKVEGWDAASHAITTTVSGDFSDDIHSHTNTFGSMIFSKAGTYTFEVTEVLPDGVDADHPIYNGIQYDMHTAKVTVRVADQNGILSAVPTYDNSQALNTSDQGRTASAAFTNIYTTSPSAPVELGGTKILTGRNMKADEFTFNLDKVSYQAPGSESASTDDEALAKMPALKDMTAKSSAAADGEPGVFTFGSADDQLTFTAPGTYVYKISEQGTGTADQGAGTTNKGITYDQTSYTAKITVSDNGKGILNTAVEYADASGKSVEPSGVVFKNTYEATPTEGVVSGEKTISTPEGGNPFTLGAGQFWFKLEPVNEAPMPDGKAALFASNGADGSFSFDTLTFAAAGTYSYVVSEVDPGAVGLPEGVDPQDIPGVSYSSDMFTVTFTVIDNGEGKLVVDGGKPEIKKHDGDVGTPTDSIAFDNRYSEIEASASISGIKHLDYDGQDVALDGRTFMFTLAPDEKDAATAAALEAGDISLRGGADSLTATSDGQTGRFTFGDDAITFKEAGDYCFTVAENEGDTEGGVIAYDTTIHTLIAHVTGEGSAESPLTWAGWTLDDGSYDGAIDFTNTYNPKPSTPVSIDVSKTLTGRDMTDGEFSFELSKVSRDGKTDDASLDSMPLPQQTTVVAGAAAQGETSTISFGDENFVFSEPGTYRYRVSEVMPPDDDATRAGTQHAGVTYDAQTFDVVIEVSDTDGQLVTDISYFKAGDSDNAVQAIAFENAYQAKPIALAPQATKHLTGRDLASQEFSFSLVDSDGNTIGTAANSKDGTVVFPAITYTEPGEYSYVLSEDLGTEQGVTYDESKYTVSVVVKDNGKGTLEAELSYAREDDGSGVEVPQFNNTYTPPTPGFPPPSTTPPSDEPTGDNGGTPMAKTGDALGPVVAILAGIVVIAGSVVFIACRKLRSHSR